MSNPLDTIHRVVTHRASRDVPQIERERMEYADALAFALELLTIDSDVHGVSVVTHSGLPLFVAMFRSLDVARALRDNANGG